MVCGNCGKEIRGREKFCPHCGALNNPDTGKKKRTGLIAGAAVSAVVAAAVLAVVVSGMFVSPKQKLGEAVAKSLAAYAQAKETLELPDLSGLERSASGWTSLRLTDLNTAMLGYDLSALEGLELRVRSDLDAEDRQLGMELAASWDDQELLSVLLAADDNQVCLASPQITGGDFYGVNTETLGEDLKRTGIQDVGEISFNFFDLLDLIAPERQPEEMGQAVKEAGKALFDAAEVEKAKKATISVNGTETKTDAYRVTIPEEALRDFVDAVSGVLPDYAAFYREVCRAVGLPEDALEELLGDPESRDPYDALKDFLFLEEPRDMVLGVHVSGGYVSAVVYGNNLLADFHDKSLNVNLGLYLGGGEEYVDDIGVVVDTPDISVKVTSSGDHGCKSGVFTDKTTVRGAFSTVVSELRYEPGKAQDNFSWELSVPGAGSLEMAGQLTFGEASAGLHLDALRLKVLGLELCSAEMDCYAGPYQGRSVTARDPRLIGEMGGLELMFAALRLQTSAQSWVKDMQTALTERLPEELLYWMR